MRLNKFIANNSKYSRRKADELIENGLVTLNNETVTKHGIDVDENTAKVVVEGKEIKIQNQNTYIALHKPSDYITSRSDEFNRKTVMSLVPHIENLKPIGRLDKDTEGLLLLSNDGEFINKFTHPKFNCDKEYQVIIDGKLEPSEIKKVEQGIIIDSKKTSESKIKILNIDKDQTTLTITIHEGRNRQVRKMFAAINHSVKYLKRIRIAHIHLSTLEKGKYRELTNTEINDF